MAAATQADGLRTHGRSSPQAHRRAQAKIQISVVTGFPTACSFPQPEAEISGAPVPGQPTSPAFQALRERPPGPEGRFQNLGAVRSSPIPQPGPLTDGWDSGSHCPSLGAPGPMAWASLHECTSRHATLSSDPLLLIPAGPTMPRVPRLAGPIERHDRDTALYTMKPSAAGPTECPTSSSQQ